MQLAAACCKGCRGPGLRARGQGRCGHYPRAHPLPDPQAHNEAAQPSAAAAAAGPTWRQRTAATQQAPTLPPPNGEGVQVSQCTSYVRSTGRMAGELGRCRMVPSCALNFLWLTQAVSRQLLADTRPAEPCGTIAEPALLPLLPTLTVLQPLT